jgi:hypothetical protein
VGVGRTGVVVEAGRELHHRVDKPQPGGQVIDSHADSLHQNKLAQNHLEALRLYLHHGTREVGQSPKERGVAAVLAGRGEASHELQQGLRQHVSNLLFEGRAGFRSRGALAFIGPTRRFDLGLYSWLTGTPLSDAGGGRLPQHHRRAAICGLPREQKR